MTVTGIFYTFFGAQGTNRNDMLSFRFDPDQYKSLNSRFEAYIVTLKQKPCNIPKSPFFSKDISAHFGIKLADRKKSRNSKKQDRYGDAEIAVFELNPEFYCVMKKKFEPFLLDNCLEFPSMKGFQMIKKICKHKIHYPSPRY